MRALKFITGHVIYNPAYTYKFQLKTTLVHTLLFLELTILIEWCFPNTSNQFEPHQYNNILCLLWLLTRLKEIHFQFFKSYSELIMI